MKLLSTGKTTSRRPPPDPARLEQIRKWIISGASEHDIAEAITEAYPDADARPLILAAARQVRKAADFDAQTVLGWCFLASQDLYRRCVEIGDFPAALRAVKQMAELSKMKD